MCTLTVVPTPDGRVRLAFNRDEQRARPAARPPERRRFGARTAVLPTDPASGGTWLAVNDAALALAVLNVTSHDGRKRTPRRSRGEVIPLLLESDSPAVALAAVERGIDYRDFVPFRLVLVGQGIVAEVTWDDRQPMVTTRLLGGAPRLFTSSGLGDHLVQDYRRELFEDLFAGPAEGWEAAQDAFHQHFWPGRKHLSVNMTRPDARTVSYSVVELGDVGAAFAYRPDAPDRPAEQVTLHLSFAPVGVP